MLKEKWIGWGAVLFVGIFAMLTSCQIDANRLNQEVKLKAIERGCALIESSR